MPQWEIKTNSPDPDPHPVLQVYEATIKELRQQVEQAKAACAEMRHLILLMNWPSDVKPLRDHALSLDCGKDYVPREKVDKLRAALENLCMATSEMSRDWRKGDFVLTELAQCDMRVVEEKTVQAHKALKETK
jgi:hypothetical protein